MLNELKQYIDFYLSQKQAIDSNSIPTINSWRDEAINVLRDCSLPKEGSENYHVTNLQAMLAPDYGINSNRLRIPVDVASIFKCDVPNLAAYLFCQCNDQLLESSDDKLATLPKGVVVTSLTRAWGTHSHIIEKCLGKLAPMSAPLVALNALLLQDGLFVYIPKGVLVERPIQIVNILAGIVPTMVTRRVLVVVEDNASGKFVFCDHTQSQEVAFLANQVIEVFVGENSHVEIYDMEESSVQTHRLSSLYASQCRDSYLLHTGVTLINGQSRNMVMVDVNERGCTTNLYGIAIGKTNEVIDNNTLIVHNAPDCYSHELYKYLLDDNSRGCFGGKIYVSPGAEKIEAYQSNNNIISSSEAKMYTKPQLEIYTDDVKCSHGATTGQLDANALFYMQSRGIPVDEAKSLLMQAFMEEVISTVNIDILRDRLKHLIEKRLKGTLALCSDCGIKCHKNG